MAGPVPFVKGAPVSGGGTPSPAPSAVIAPKPAVPTPAAQESSAPAVPRERGRFVRKPAEALKPAPVAKRDTSAEEQAAQKKETEEGINEIQAFLDKKNKPETVTKAASVQAAVEAKADESAPEEVPVEAPKADEPVTVLDEATKKRALDAGFKAEELDGLTTEQVQTQVVLRDRWIAEQGVQLASEKKPAAEAQVPKVEARPVQVEAPVDTEFKLAWKKPEDREDTVVDPEIQANVEALHKHYDTKFQAQAKDLAALKQYVQQQEQTKLATEVQGYIAALPNKDSFSTKPLVELDPKVPADKLTLDVLQTAAGMEVYYAQRGQKVPSRKDLIERAAAVVTGLTPPKPKPATTSARATSRQSPQVPNPNADRQAALGEIDNFVKSKGGF